MSNTPKPARKKLSISFQFQRWRLRRGLVGIAKCSLTHFYDVMFDLLSLDASRTKEDRSNTSSLRTLYDDIIFLRFWLMSNANLYSSSARLAQLLQLSRRNSSKTDGLQYEAWKRIKAGDSYQLSYWYLIDFDMKRKLLLIKFAYVRDEVIPNLPHQQIYGSSETRSLKTWVA